MIREDDFAERRKHLANMSDQELYDHYWATAEKVIDPLIKLGKENTTPSIERAVLLRMGVSSLDTQAIVEGCMDRGLMGYGAGHVVYRISKDYDMSIREASIELAKGNYWDEAVEIFKNIEKEAK